MKSPLAALSSLLPLLVLGACGGSSQADAGSDQSLTAEPPIADATDAAADGTKASTEVVNAAEADVAVTEAPWLLDFQELAQENGVDAALNLFATMKEEQGERLTSENLLKMAMFAIEVEKSIELTQPILDYAIATFPKEIGKFGGIDAAIYRLQNPQVAELPLEDVHAAIEGNPQRSAAIDAAIENAANLKASGAVSE